MRATNDKILLKRYPIKLIVIFLLCIQFFYTTVSASEATIYELGIGENVYSFDEILRDYQSFSTTYQLNSITYQLQALDGTIAMENYNSIQNQYSETSTHLASLKEAKENLLLYKENTTDAEVIAEIDTQINTINSQIDQYNKTINSTNQNMTQAKLQEDIAAYYNIYHSEILLEARNKLKNEFKKKCFNLIVLKEKQDYYQSYNKYLELIFTIENIKYKKGLSGITDLDLAKTNLMNNDLEISKNQIAYDTSYAFIKSEANLKDNARINFPLSIEKKNYNTEQITKNFISNNSSILQLHNFVRSYNSYLTNCTGLSYYEASLKIDHYNLQDKELRENIKAFVQHAILSYEQSFQSLNAASEELQLKVKQLNITNIKKEHKMATELDLRKIEYEKDAAEANYYQLCYNIVIWQDILDNNLYNVTP